MPQVLNFMVFAEYHQFLVQDSDTDETLPVHWEPEDEENMVQCGHEVLSIRTARELDVAVQLEIADSEPDHEDLLFEDWDQVVSCHIEIPSAKLLVFGTSEALYEVQRVSLPEAGTYGVRLFFGRLEEIDDEGFEGEDMYRIYIWKIGKDDDIPEVRILKRWEPRQRF